MQKAKPLDELLRLHAFPEPVNVTRPTLPELSALQQKLEPVWESCWLTNDGPLQRELESNLTDYLDVDYLSLCCNGTIALLLALQAARINGGEVITTPFTFPATPHALYWNRVRPIFCDIDPATFNLDPERIERHIGPDTRAILAVHLFGVPCDVEAIQSIADRHGLTVIYDAAHVMGVGYKGESILRHGDISVLSFHATKVFTTAEGGGIVSKLERLHERIGFLKNFGIADEETVIGPGINGKMNELQAALGILQLQGLDEEILRRKHLTGIYRDRLAEVPGLRFREETPDVRHNYSYFTILIDPDLYGMTRDELYTQLKRFNVHPRKYFYPLCSHYSCYSSEPSASPDNLPVAEWAAQRVLALPLYGSLDPAAVETVCEIIAQLHS